MIGSLKVERYKPCKQLQVCFFQHRIQPGIGEFEPLIAATCELLFYERCKEHPGRSVGTCTFIPSPTVPDTLVELRYAVFSVPRLVVRHTLRHYGTDSSIVWTIERLYVCIRKRGDVVHPFTCDLKQVYR